MASLCYFHTVIHLIEANLDIYDRVIDQNPQLNAEIEKIVEEKMRKIRQSAVIEESKDYYIDNDKQEIIDSISALQVHSR